MSRPKPDLARSALTAALLLCLATSVAVAETIYLEGGTVLRGTIVSQTAQTVTLRIETKDGGTAVVTIQRSQIRRMAADDETPEDMTERGMQLLRAGELDKAEQVLRDALAARPTHTPAMVGLALATGARGDLDEAIAKLQRALLLANTDATIWYQLGKLQIKAGRYTDADKSFRNALALRPPSELKAEVKAQLSRLGRIAAAGQRAANAQVAGQRARFDKELGNNANAAAAGQVCLQMLKNLTRTMPRFDGDIFLELKAHPAEERRFAAGGSKLRYQTAVRICQISFLVDIRSWEQLTNREKREIIGSWIRYLKDLYPYATTICVVSDGRRHIAEAIWYDFQNDVKIHWYRSRDGRRH